MQQSTNPSMHQSDNPVLKKSYAFSIAIVHFCLKLQKQKKEYVLSKQLLKSGTSIGANIEEAQRPQSRADFLSKMSIALKEAYESRYWLRIMQDCDLASSSVAQPLLEQLEEVIRLLGAITSTSKSRANRKH